MKYKHPFLTVYPELIETLELVRSVYSGWEGYIPDDVTNRIKARIDFERVDRTLRAADKEYRQLDRGYYYKAPDFFDDQTQSNFNSILIQWALRFDGWRYIEINKYKYLDDQEAVLNGKFPEDKKLQLTHFFLLQRFLYKWGGEGEPYDEKYWITFRKLFFMTFEYEIDHEYRSSDWYDEWEKYYFPYKDMCYEVIEKISNKIDDGSYFKEEEPSHTRNINNR